MKKKLGFVFLFLLLNFGALGLGSILMGGSPASNEWYQNLPKAPWTPPGYVFGIAWTTIMICFSVYMAQLMSTSQRRVFIRIYIIQWFLNVMWNPIFFQFHLIVAALFVITCLFIVVFWLGLESRKNVSPYWNLLIFPYVIWLSIAISLNAYPVFY